MNEAQNKLLTDSKSFCVAPWMSVYVHPNGNVLPCCNWDLNDPIGNINDLSLKEIYQSNKTKEIKNKMISGEVVKQCSNCINNEKLNSESYRQRLNRDYPQCVEYVDEDKTKFHLWDIRITNLCNFKCRMCYHGFSSSWFNDAVSMNMSHSDRAIITLDDTNDFLSQLGEHYEYVEEIYFAGGEPLISEHHYQILDEIIKRNKQVYLRYSTNLSKITFKNKHIFDYWSHFNNITLFPSLDGLGSVGEYIRSGFKTDIFIDNAKKVSQFLTNSHIFYTFSYGALNYLHTFDMVIELINQGLIDKNINYSRRRMLAINPIYGPDYLSCKWISDTIKNRFKFRLQIFNQELDSLGVSNDVKKEIMDLLEAIYLFSVSDVNDLNKNDLYQKFKEYNETLDSLRLEKFESEIGLKLSEYTNIDMI
jgi:radical SAM protein with 4Fe4S-binding SPASM domain